MRQLGARRPSSSPRGRRAAPPLPWRWPHWLRIGLRRGLWGAAVLGVGSGAFWLWHSGMIAGAYRASVQYGIDASAELGLTIGDVMVEGRKETKAEALLTALGVKRGMPLLALDLEAARAHVLALPWVRKASLERRWPDLLFVRIEERQPLALWQHEGRIGLVDLDGQVIAGADIHRFASLPMVVGDGAVKQASALVAMLAAQPALASHVSSAVWVGNRRWNIELQEGIELRLPELDAAGALQRFALLERQQRLLARNVVMIDLRVPDRLIVRLAPNVNATPPAKAGKST